MTAEQDRPSSDPSATSGTEPGSTPEARRSEATPAAAARTPVTQKLGRLVMVVLAALFGIFAVFNSQPVDFNWVFGETQVTKQGDQVVSGGVPLILLLVVAFVTGAVIGRLSTWRRTRELKRAVRSRTDG